MKDNFIKKNIEGEETSKIISCKTIEPTKISELFATDKNETLAKLKVVIDKFEVINEGVFSFDYAMYTVTTPLFEWIV